MKIALTLRKMGVLTANFDSVDETNDCDFSEVLNSLKRIFRVFFKKIKSLIC